MHKWLLTALCLLLILGLGYQFWLDSMPAITPAPLPEPTLAATEPPAGVQDPAVRKPAGIDIPLQPPTAASTASAVQRGRLLSIDGQGLAGRVMAWVDPAAPRRDGTNLVVANTWTDLEQESIRQQLATKAGRRRFASQFAPHAAAVLALLEGRELALSQASTDGDGRFELTADGNGVLRLLDKDLVLLASGHLPDDPEQIHLAAPAVDIAGSVRDERGAPLAGVFVSASYSLDGLPGIASRLSKNGAFRSRSTTSDETGRIRLARVPAHEALRVIVQKRGFQSLSVATNTIVGPVDWVLRDSKERAVTLTGTVRHPDGRPAGGARVDFGQDGGAADATGAFAIALTNWDDATLLTAWCEGQQPATLAGLGKRLRQDATAGAALQLELGGPALTIRGRVLDADGKPLRGLRVVAVDALPLGSSDQVLEEAIGGLQKVTSDTDGYFELSGLSNRNYHVRAGSADSLLVLEATTVAAGSKDLELRAAADAFVGRCAGTVVDQRGVPVAGAEVRLRAVLRRCGAFSMALYGRQKVRTDAAGRFELTDCPRHGVQWDVSGDAVVTTSIDAPTDRGPVRLVVARQLLFRLTAATGDSAQVTAFEVHDADGRALFTTARRPDMRSTGSRVSIAPKASAYEVDERATTLVLFAGDRELRRMPVTLRVGDVNEIAY